MKNSSFNPIFLLVFLFVGFSCKQSGKELTPPLLSQVNDSIQTSLSYDEKVDSMIPIADNSRVSIDWAGTYRGIIPCADCKGIKTELILDQSGTFRLGTLYLSKNQSEPTIREGRFEWDKTGNKIMLKDIAEGEGPRQFQVGEEKVFQLDNKANRITGQLAEKYILHKYYSDTILTEKHWKLIEVNGKKTIKNLNEPFMILSNEQVKGNSGCNTFSASVKITPMNRISIQGLISTRMACVDEEGKRTESLFFNAMKNADQFFIKNDTLILSKSQMTPLAKFVYDYLKE